MKRYLVYTTDDSRTRPIDPTRFPASAPPQNRRFRVRVEKDGLAVGRPVPRLVHFVAVPQAIFAIEPAWRGYDYFMVGDQIVIVDPRSMEIVAILEA